MDLKDQIRIAREAKGYDRETLADLLNVSVQSVKFWEDEGKGPKLRRMKEIEEVLGTSFNITGEKTDNQYLSDITKEDAEMMIQWRKLPRMSQDVISILISMLVQDKKKLTPINSVAFNALTGSFNKAKNNAAAAAITK